MRCARNASNVKSRGRCSQKKKKKKKEKISEKCLDSIEGDKYKDKKENRNNSSLLLILRKRNRRNGKV